MKVTATNHSSADAVSSATMSGYSVTAATPTSNPALWEAYLRGAQDAYGRYGCSGALDYDRVVGGEETMIFFAVSDDAGNVCGGLRVQPTITAAAQSHALEEWAGQPGQVRLVNAIEERIAEGVVEVKTAWTDERSPIAKDAVGQLSRLGLAVFELCEVRYVMATAADHVLRRWTSGGGRVDETVPATPFPDERYRTQLMWWDRKTLQASTSGDVWARMCRETDSLVRAFSLPDSLRAA